MTASEAEAQSALQGDDIATRGRLLRELLTESRAYGAVSARLLFAPAVDHASCISPSLELLMSVEQRCSNRLRSTIK